MGVEVGVGVGLGVVGLFRFEMKRGETDFYLPMREGDGIAEDGLGGG